MLLTGRKYLHQKAKERAKNDQVIETFKQNYKYKYKRPKENQQHPQQRNSLFSQPSRNSMKFH